MIRFLTLKLLLRVLRIGQTSLCQSEMILQIWVLGHQNQWSAFMIRIGNLLLHLPCPALCTWVVFLEIWRIQCLTQDLEENYLPSRFWRWRAVYSNYWVTLTLTELSSSVRAISQREIWCTMHQRNSCFCPDVTSVLSQYKQDRCAKLQSRRRTTQTPKQAFTLQSLR